MRACYKSIFHVGEAAQGGPVLADVASLCLDWARQRFPQASLRWDQDAEVTVGDASLEIANATSESAQLWGVRLSHADTHDGAVRWATEVVLAKSDSLRFACRNSFGSTDGVLARTWRNPSRPRVVADLLRRWGGHHGLSLSTRAQVLRDDEHEVARFVAMLSDPKRSRPVVLVSGRNWNDLPVIDGHQLADWLAGIAHVWVAENRFPSLKLKAHLPDHLNCWDGSVRMYWPRFSKLAHPYDHKFWRADEVAEIQQRRENGFREYLLGQISGVAVFAQDPSERTWVDLEAARRRSAIEQSRKAGDINELERLVDEEMHKLEERVNALSAQLSERAEALRAAERERDYWKDQYLEGVAKKPESGSVPPPAPDVRSVNQVLDIAANRFAERLVFSLNGKSDKHSAYAEPSEALVALEFLATTYWECKVRERNAAETDDDNTVDFDLELRELCGWSYAGSQSEITMSKYEPWYTTKWNGTKYWLGNHIGRGTSKDPRQSIRIGFAWNADEQKIVIGFIGQHQKTDAT